MADNKKVAPRRNVSRTRKTPADETVTFDDVREAAAEDLAIAPKMREANADRVAALQESVKDVTVAKIVQDISNIELGIGSSLNDVSRRLTEQARLLEDLTDAVTVEKAELQRLHKVDVGLTTLDALVREYDLKKSEFEHEKARSLAEWEEEERLREKESREFDVHLKKQRQREQEEYDYAQGLIRKKAEDDFTIKMRNAERELQEKRLQLEKTWKAREEELKTRENELASLRSEAAEFPTKLKIEIDTAVTQAVKEASGRHKQEFTLAQKDFEADKKIAEMRIKSLEETAARQSSEIASLQLRLEESKRQVQDIAVKAIESTSGARALSHVSQIAMEQAKPRVPQ